MADETAPNIDMDQRPFLADLATPSNIPALHRAAPTGQAHLFAASTRQSTLHLVDAPAPAPDAPLKRRRTPEARMSIDTVARAASMVVDWRQVDRFVKSLDVDMATARSRQDFDVATASATPETPYEESVLTQIHALVHEHVRQLGMNSGPENEWSDALSAEYIQAVFDSVFRYGRLQQYLREDDIEDISIVGHDNVMVTKTNGLKERRPACADSVDDLERIIYDIASWRGRAFSRPYGRVDLDIGGARFAGIGRPNNSVPNVTIRKHNHVDIDLDSLAKLGTITPKMRQLLEALVRANLSALVSGWAGTGKTTFLRGWMSAIPRDDKIVTIETERELYLGKLAHRHAQVQDFECVPYALAGSDMEARFTLEDAFLAALRSSAKRILFGEIRGPEGPIAIRAMKAGMGSISTIHARNAADALDRFVDILMEEQRLSDDASPMRQVLRSINIVVHLDTITTADGTSRRIVSEIAEVIPQPNKQIPMASRLVAWNYDQQQYDMPEKPSTDLAATLRRAGLDDEFFYNGAN
ncbi:ATPase, T2SS/T4P/T4SS family [Clavibacter nebraskensis]|uniref:ATPase, T2SS/T4P/T4SS family n=1 Tax=Clavibacter nebraskensis TaxID=31963 RepID=UPI003F4CA3D5